MGNETMMETAEKKTPVKAVLFDLDGTLLDTLPDLVTVTNATLRDAGYPERSREEIIWMIGNGSVNLLKRALPSPDLFTDALYQEMLKTYHRYQNTDTKPFPGIGETLAALKERGVRTAIVTNKPDEAAQEVSEKYFSGLIDDTVGIRTGENVKPDPRTAFRAMRYFGVSPEQCLYVGDSDTDIETAKNAGVRCLSAAWGYRGEAFLLEHGAKTVIRRPEDILRFIPA